MPNLDAFKRRIEARLEELGRRMNEIELELDKPKSKDAEEQAVDLEDDEVLEGLGLAAQREVSQLQGALTRIDDGTFGICDACGGEISEARLEAVPYAVLCKDCATAAERR